MNKTVLSKLIRIVFMLMVLIISYEDTAKADWTMMDIGTIADTHLDEGQKLVRLYEWSPAIVKAMEGDEKFKEEVKEMIDGVLGLVGGEVE